jgi:glutathione S-transferase
MPGPVLWHIEVSHYNEKVRWALDHKRVPHVRRAPPPGLMHPVVALAKTGKPFLPVLDLDGETYADSTAIIAELERRFPEPLLYPADPEARRRALDLEDFFDEEVAPNVRRFLFYEISRDPEVATEALQALGGPVPPGPLAGRFVGLVARRYGGSPQTLDEAREQTRTGFERLLDEIGPSGYLVGDGFTVADLTAAAVLFHLAEPPEFPYTIPPWPDRVLEFRESLPPEALEWVRQIYRRHRASGIPVA